MQVLLALGSEDQVIQLEKERGFKENVVVAINTQKPSQCKCNAHTVIYNFSIQVYCRLFYVSAKEIDLCSFP